jgi:hypothetical protein
MPAERRALGAHHHGTNGIAIAGDGGQRGIRRSLGLTARSGDGGESEERFD